MTVQLIRKLADHLDGIDLSEYEQGDVLDLPSPYAELLIAERWAIEVDTDSGRPVATPPRDA